MCLQSAGFKGAFLIGSIERKMLNIMCIAAVEKKKEGSLLNWAHTAYDRPGRVLLLAAIEYEWPVSTCKERSLDLNRINGSKMFACCYCKSFM